VIEAMIVDALIAAEDLPLVKGPCRAGSAGKALSFSQSPSMSGSSSGGDGDGQPWERLAAGGACEGYNLVEAADCVEAYVQLTDSVLKAIESSFDPRSPPARRTASSGSWIFLSAQFRTKWWRVSVTSFVVLRDAQSGESSRNH
jgi:hypothetical protein